jgi:hypothetical protein
LDLKRNWIKDGFEGVAKHSANEISFCKDLLKFLKKRKEIEEEYAKSLGKLAQKTQYATSQG